MEESQKKDFKPPSQQNPVEAESTPWRRHSRHRRHRPWYKRWWRALFPTSNAKRLHVLLAVLIVTTLSILAGFYVAMNSGSAVSSVPAP